MHMGSRLKELRLQRGLTQTELAAPSYTSAYVSTIEAGRRQPSRKALDHFAGKLQVEPDYLLTGRSSDLRPKLLADYLEARRLLASGKRGSDSEAEKRLERILKESKKFELRDIQARAAYGLGLVAELRNHLEEALERYEEGERFLALESPLLRVDLVAGKARVLHARGEVARAAFLIEKALAELTESGLEDPESLVRLHTSLVAAYFNKGLYREAARSAEIALELSSEVKDQERLANMHLNVAIMLTRQEHWREAEARFADAERHFEELSFRTDAAKVQLARALGLRDRGEWDEARLHLQKALEVFQRAGQDLNEARASIALATLERVAGNLNEGRFAAKRSMSLAGEDPAIKGMALRELGLCDASTDRTSALKHLREALATLEGADDARELAITYRELGNLLSEKEELREACDAYRAAADLFEAA